MRRRSVSYPRISVGQAVERLPAFRDGRAAGLPADRSLGVKRSGFVLSALAAMKAYGLVDGFGNELELTALGERALSIDPSSRLAALQAAAVRPSLFMALLGEPDDARWREAAIDAGCRPEVVPALLKTFRRSLEDARIDASAPRRDLTQMRSDPHSVGRKLPGATLFGHPSSDLIAFLNEHRSAAITPGRLMARGLSAFSAQMLIDMLSSAGMIRLGEPDAAGERPRFLSEDGRRLASALPGALIAGRGFGLAAWFRSGWTPAPLRPEDRSGVDRLDPIDVIAWDDECSPDDYPGVRFLSRQEIISEARLRGWPRPDDDVVATRSSGPSRQIVLVRRVLDLDRLRGAPVARARIEIVRVSVDGSPSDRLRGLVSCAWAIVGLIERDAAMLCALMRDLAYPFCPTDIDVVSLDPFPAGEAARRMLLMGLAPLADMGFSCDDESDHVLWPVRPAGAFMSRADAVAELLG